MSNWEKPPTSESKRRAVIAATIGNMLEASLRLRGLWFLRDHHITALFSCGE